MRRAVLLALLLPLLAACGGLEAATGIPDPFGTPQPFRGSGDQRLVGDAMGERPVYVGAITGLTPEAELELRKQIATNAAALDVMASADTVPVGSLTLTGAATGAATAFTLANGDQAVASFTVEGDASMLAALAARRLAETLGRLGAPPPTPAAPLAPGEAPTAARPARNAPLVFVGKIATPKPDQAAPLRRALTKSLADMGARIAETEDGAYRVTATLGIGPDVQGRTAISIVWRVFAPDGTDLGQAAQDNTLPTAAVTGTWAEQATLAGNAAARSVAKLIAGHFNRGK